MPVSVINNGLELSPEEVGRLWLLVRERVGVADDTVTVKCVDAEEIKNLNIKYRKKDEETNVLTFSYGDGSHDVAVCVEVVAKEAFARALDLHNYTAWILTHAFLHAAGMDHEEDEVAAKEMSEAEKAVLGLAGYQEVWDA